MGARNELAAVIATGRDRRGETQDEFGAHMGVKGNQVSRWERCQAIPDPDYATKLAVLCGIGKRELLELIGAARRELSRVREQRLDEILGELIDTVNELVNQHILLQQTQQEMVLELRRLTEEQKNSLN